VPPYPTPSNARDDAGPPPVPTTRTRQTEGADDDLREELRRIIIEELHDMIGGGRDG
jgi:hypothetical protein